MSNGNYQNNSCGNYGNFGGGNCCCNFPALVILILIVLQFGRRERKEECDDEENYGRGQLVDNSILFIIALFYLSCCNPCRQQYS